MLIDTHTHLNFRAYADDWEEVMHDTFASGVARVIVVGTTVTTSNRAIEIAESDPRVYAAIGIHPHHARQFLEADDYVDSIEADVNKLVAMTAHEKVVAIGEIGLDEHVYTGSSYRQQDSANTWERLRLIQTRLFLTQVNLARERRLPVIVHSREVGDRVLALLEQAQYHNGVFHCFEGGKGYVDRVIAAGFMVSFTANILFSQGRDVVASRVPLPSLLLESDSPYMTPPPHRGERNSPKIVRQLAEYHAALRKTEVDEIIRQTGRNAQELFGIQ